MIMMAEAPAASATFVLVVKLQLPRWTRMTSPVSYQCKSNQEKSKSRKKLKPEIHNTNKEYYSTKNFFFFLVRNWKLLNLVFGSGATVRRVRKGEFDEGSMFLLRFQGRTKPSTNTNILLFFFPIDSSWDFDLVHGICTLVRRWYSKVKSHESHNETPQELLGLHNETLKKQMILEVARG